MYLNDLEETVVLIAAVFIIIAFVVKTYKDIKETIVEENKIEYVEDRCTKMEYQKHFLKVRQAFPVLQS